MKTVKFKTGKSLIRVSLIYFVLCALLILFIYASISYVISRQPSEAFPTINTLLKYSDELAEDDFSQIPLKDLKNCQFIIFNEDYKAIFMTDKEIGESIRQEDLDFIQDYGSNTYYEVYNYYGRSGKQRYFVMKNSVNLETGSTDIDSFCVLDSNYNIKNGDLFADRGKLSDREVSLLQGILSSKQVVQKYEYATLDGDARTLVFVGPTFSLTTYNEAMQQTQKMWYIAIPAALIVILVLSLLFSRRLRAYIQPLDRAIVEYCRGNRMNINKKQLPSEFQGIADNFDRMVDQLEQSKADTEQAYQERQRILADISHDLKTPLTVIQGYAKALEDGIVPDDKKKQYIRAIYNKAVSMSSLTESLFEYTKVEHPEYTISAQETNLSEYCKEYLAEKYSEIELKHFELVVDIPETPIKGMADHDLIRRLFDNLIGNTLKYNPSGTQITFRLSMEKGNILISIADNGVGIPEEIRDKAFVPFVTGDAARTSGNGTGLGMAISQRIVELHGGSIRLANPPSKGFSTEFVITLPALDKQNIA